MAQKFSSIEWQAWVSREKPVRMFRFHVVYVPSHTGAPDVELAEFGHREIDRQAAQTLAELHGGYVVPENRPAEGLPLV